MKALAPQQPHLPCATLLALTSETFCSIAVYHAGPSASTDHKPPKPKSERVSFFLPNHCLVAEPTANLHSVILPHVGHS